VASALSKMKGGPLHLLLMGSAAELTGPKTKTVFLEDLPPEEIAKVQEPSGLENLGNTCYMNSVVQCLRAVPQLRRGLDWYHPRVNSAQANFLVKLQDTYRQLDRTANAIAPSSLVRATKLAFPQFAQTGPNGAPLQQDAEEFFSGLMTIAAAEMNQHSHMHPALPDASESELGGASNLSDALFGLKMEETLTCDEFDDKGASGDDKMQVEASTGPIEPPVKSYDLLRKLVCNIQGGPGSGQINVGHLAEGINLSLNGSIEKHSDVLGRDAVWTRKQRIARLPPIICVQFGRFYWKATPESSDHAGVKCKVMKPVTFNSILDVYDFCTEDVQKELKKSRDKALQEEEDRISRKLKGEDAEDKMNTEKSGDDEEDSALQAALAMSMQSEDEAPKPVGPGLPPNFQGQYELFAVVTHKGRDADGGHYMAWVKASRNSGKVEKIVDSEEDNEDWFVFDDDEVSPCKTEDVLKLKGGGDWHMSYLNFYRAKK